MFLAYRLTFTLPPVLDLVPAGRHHPCIAGCMLDIGKLSQVTVTGPSRESVFDQAARFFRVIARGHTSIEPFTAVLMTPGNELGRGGSDTLTITLNAEIAFTFSALAPEVFPRVAPRPVFGKYRTQRRAGGRFTPSFV